MRLHGRDRLADAALQGHLGRDRRKIRDDRERPRHGQRRRLHALPEVGRRERQAELGVTYLVDGGGVGVAHQIGRGAEREELHREPRERSHRGVLEEAVARPRLRERAPRGGGHLGDAGARPARQERPGRRSALTMPSSRKNVRPT